MSVLPSSQALHNCIDWNETERRRASREAKDNMLKVPGHIQIGIDEYREIRRKDAERYAANIESLRAKL